MLTFGSVFAGIGGLDLGLERAGMRCRWQIEIDPFCQRVLAKHWPEVPRYADVTEVKAADLEPVDLICGGFPCQDVSFSGYGDGVEHGRESGLYFDLLRLVRHLRPRVVLLENVAALLAAGRGMDAVLGSLAACGYDAEWDCLPAGAFGADHFRDRTFVLAHPRGSGRSGVLCGESRVCSAPPRKRPSDALAAVGDLVQRLEQRLGESALCRAADGVPDRVDRLRALGNAVVPQVAEWIGRRILASL